MITKPASGTDPLAQGLAAIVVGGDRSRDLRRPAEGAA